jgi:hypothetical protein
MYDLVCVVMLSVKMLNIIKLSVMAPVITSLFPESLFFLSLLSLMFLHFL